MSIKIISRTNKGLIRENNEDNHVFSPDVTGGEWKFFDQTNISAHQNAIVLAVADGMGGLELGEMASQIAIDTIKAKIPEIVAKMEENTLPSQINQLFSEINQNIVEYSRKEAQRTELGTTLIVALVNDNKLNLFWIGDSRCYLFRDNQILPLSKDHSYVQDLVDKGLITYEQAFFHPEGNIITQYLGNPKESPIPSHNVFGLKAGDKLLLCSDGLNGMLQDKDIEVLFSSQPDTLLLADELISGANHAGGQDNITVIISEFGSFLNSSFPISDLHINHSTNFGDAKNASDISPNCTRKRRHQKRTILYSVLGIVILYFILAFVFGFFPFSESSQPSPDSRENLHQSISKIAAKREVFNEPSIATHDNISLVNDNKENKRQPLVIPENINTILEEIRLISSDMIQANNPEIDSVIQLRIEMAKNSGDTCELKTRLSLLLYYQSNLILKKQLDILQPEINKLNCKISEQ
ncbi:MAG: protein phosphatase 2C domain-containing protein [Bacteroidetes bacterium]|nr:protein phosphatase 2C domain-containing protein [Bacteroidota bacterium]MBU1718128.1 protein phosphatase 2C domain-containing protein [Bacteroidota bacterium]